MQRMMPDTALINCLSVNEICGIDGTYTDKKSKQKKQSWNWHKNQWHIKQKA